MENYEFGFFKQGYTVVNRTFLDSWLVEITWTVLLNTESIYIYNMDDIYIIWMIYI